MTQITLDKVYEDIKEIKIELKRIATLLEEDFELSDDTKKELEDARKEPLLNYIDHEEVLKEFS